MKKILLSLSFVLTLHSDNNQTQELSLFDDKDGILDISNYLSQAYYFSPLPIFIIELAVGYGGGAGKAFRTNQFGINSKNFGLKVGLDIATSEYSNLFYIQMDSDRAGLGV